MSCFNDCEQKKNVQPCIFCENEFCKDCLSCRNEMLICFECEEFLCPSCENFVMNMNANESKICTICKRNKCISCIAVTGCQTIYGTCKECFDYKCTNCGIFDLDKNVDIYIEDDDPIPQCEKCLSTH